MPAEAHSAGNVAVVTGGGRGIGREIAHCLVGRGYEVLVSDVDLESAKTTADALGDRAWPMALDVRVPEAHRAAAAAATERGRLAVWVNNAGVVRTEKAWEHSDGDVRLIVEANLLGVMWGTRAAIEVMRRDGSDGAHVINIASMSAFGPVPGLATYGATKHAVLAFTMSLQGDLDQAGIPIRVHAVCPDPVATQMVFDHVHEPDAAILFSGLRLLDAADVAARAVSLLDTDKIVLAVPRNRAWLARSAAPFPRVGLKVMALLRWLGDRKRRRTDISGRPAD